MLAKVVSELNKLSSYETIFRTASSYIVYTIKCII